MNSKAFRVETLELPQECLLLCIALYTHRISFDFHSVGIICCCLFVCLDDLCKGSLIVTATKHPSCYQHSLAVSLAMLVVVLTLFIF